MSIAIRPATTDDIPFILNAVHDINIQSGYTEPHYLTEITLAKDVFSEDPAASVIIASHDNQSAGFILYSNMYATALGPYLWAVQIFTHPDYRKQGVASKMLSYLQTHNPKSNAICWAVTADNKAAQPAFDKITSTKLNDVTFYIMKG